MKTLSRHLYILIIQIFIIIFSVLSTQFVLSQNINWQQLGNAGEGYSFCWNSDSTKLYMANNDGILRSLDSGNTWYNIYPVPGPTGSGVQTVIMKNDTLYGNLNGCYLRGIRCTADDGLTWTRIDSSVTTSYEIAANTTSIFAADYNYIYYTHNNGLNWQRINTPDSSNGALSVAVDNHVICVGGSRHKIHISPDNGATWTIHNIPGAGAIWSVFVSGNKIFAGTTIGLFRSNDLGNTWSAVPGFLNQNITAIKFFGQYGYVGTYYTGNLVYFSADSGNTWTIANSNLPIEAVWDFTVIGNRIIAGTSSGIWHTSFFDPTTTNEIGNFHTDFSLYPNPVTDVLTVSSVSNESSEFSLFDIASRKLLQQSFTNNTSIHTAQLATGIYIYEVRNKNGVVKKGKLVKE